MVKSRAAKSTMMFDYGWAINGQTGKCQNIYYKRLDKEDSATDVSFGRRTTELDYWTALR